MVLLTPLGHAGRDTAIELGGLSPSGPCNGLYFAGPPRRSAKRSRLRARFTDSPVRFQTRSCNTRTPAHNTATRYAEVVERQPAQTRIVAIP